MYHCPLHPYTEALISAIPQADPLREQHKKD
ncbi:ABC transporter ATP-binding protein [Sporolactobacillus inulinus]